MRGNTDGGRGRRVIDIVGQADHIVPRVVVVGQVTGDAFNAHARHAICRQHRTRRVCAGHSTGITGLAVALEGTVHAGTRPKGKEHRRQDEQEIIDINTVKVHTIASGLHWLRLHRLMQLSCDRPAEGAVGVGMDGGQRGGGVLHLDLTHHKDIVVKDEFDLLVLHIVALDHPGTAVQLQAAAAGEKMLVITISGDLSGTYQSALLAAEEYAGRIRVIDSRQATVGEQLVVNRALQLMDNGLGLDAIADRLEAEKEEIHTIGLLDTLEYLKKGGRISKTVAFVGGALAIKPVVAIVDGKVILLGKARGSKNGENFLMREAEKAGLDFSRPICLGYTGFSDAMLQKYMEDSRHLWEGHEDNLPICTIGATIGTHIGPNAIALSFFEKK